MSVIKLSCECRSVQGHLKIENLKQANHIVCMCDDCQAFAHYLNRESDILDEYGGTRIFQVGSGQLQIDIGSEKIKCLKLSPKGTSRFFASCCNTPIANMVSLKVSFAGVVHSFIEDKTLYQDLEPQYKCMSAFARKPFDGKGAKGFPKILTLKIIKKSLLDYIKKDYLPNSFFDVENGDCLHKVVLISKEEKSKLKENLT